MDISDYDRNCAHNYVKIYFLVQLWFFYQCVHLCMFVYECMYICICVCMYVCMYMCVHVVYAYMQFCMMYASCYI